MVVGSCLLDLFEVVNVLDVVFFVSSCCSVCFLTLLVFSKLDKVVQVVFGG